jgi:hypothetical protein
MSSVRWKRPISCRTPVLIRITSATAFSLGDIHTLFDLGLITVNPVDLTVILDPSLGGTAYKHCVSGMCSSPFGHRLAQPTSHKGQAGGQTELAVNRPSVSRFVSFR